MRYYMGYISFEGVSVVLKYDFEKRWNFHNCLYSINGKDVAIQTPQHAESMYYNCKGTHNIVLIEVVNSNYELNLQISMMLGVKAAMEFFSS